MLLQTSTARPISRIGRWSIGFEQLWRLLVCGRRDQGCAANGLGHPGDRQIYEQYLREQRVNAMIPDRRRWSTDTVWGHSQIGWGPSPSGRSIRIGAERNAPKSRESARVRDEKSPLAPGKAGKVEGRTLSPEDTSLRRMLVNRQRDNDGNHLDHDGLMLAEQPCAEFPRGRAYVVTIARQYPERFDHVWRKLNPKQRRVLLDSFGDTGSTTQEVGELHGMIAQAVWNMLDRIQLCFASAGLPALMQCKPTKRSGPDISYSEKPIYTPRG